MARALIELINAHPLAGTDFLACIQCGRCVGSCPAARVSPSFNMRTIIKRIIEGDEAILSEPEIWDCFYCQACVSLCPRDSIDPFKTIIILRDLAIKRGHGLDHLARILPVMAQYVEKGVLTDGESWMDPLALEEVKMINEKTGLLDNLARLGGTTR